jgi:hypothetical protein
MYIRTSENSTSEKSGIVWLKTGFVVKNLWIPSTHEMLTNSSRILEIGLHVHKAICLEDDMQEGT